MIPELEKAAELDVNARLELIRRPPVLAEEAVVTAAVNVGENNQPSYGAVGRLAE